MDYCKELNDVLLAIDDTLPYLRNALDSLKKAKGWGIYDMIGGGMISSLIKHNHMETAQSNIEIAKQRIERLKRELLDIRVNLPSDISGDFLMDLGDIFFDNIFMDFLTQQKINEAYNQIEKMIDFLEGLRNETLRRMNY